MTFSTRSKQSGFTLLEVLVGFTILSSAVLMALYSFSEGVWRLQRTSEYLLAAHLAESRVAELGVVYPLSTGSWRDQTEDGAYSWEVDVRPFQDEYVSVADDGLTLFEVAVVVSWEKGLQTRRFSHYTLKAGYARD